ncbi:Uncharacterised protein [uncultured archaeon]|nr:Uncharacterised protein [uncultured archaeon]
MSNLKRFFFKGKGQAEIISALLIVGITVAAVSVAYMWGVPIIQKGQSTSQIQEAESAMNDIEKAISDVEQNGGKKSVSLNLDGSMEISEDDNAIKYSIASKKAGVARTEWVPLNDDETFGVAGTPQNQSIPIYGTDKEGLLIAKASALDSGYLIDYRLVYREVDDLETKEGRITTISAVGNNKASAGNVKLLISREPQVISSVPSKLGGKLTLTKISIAIS